MIDPKDCTKCGDTYKINWFCVDKTTKLCKSCNSIKWRKTIDYRGGIYGQAI